MDNKLLIQYQNAYIASIGRQLGGLGPDHPPRSGAWRHGQQPGTPP